MRKGMVGSMIGGDDINQAIDRISKDAGEQLDGTVYKKYRTWSIEDDFTYNVANIVIKNQMNTNQFKFDDLSLDDARVLAANAALILAAKIKEKERR